MGGYTVWVNRQDGSVIIERSRDEGVSLSVAFRRAKLLAGWDA